MKSIQALERCTHVAVSTCFTKDIMLSQAVGNGYVTTIWGTSNNLISLWYVVNDHYTDDIEINIKTILSDQFIS